MKSYRQSRYGGTLGLENRNLEVIKEPLPLKPRILVLKKKAPTPLGGQILV